LDIELLAKSLRQLLRDEASENVGTARRIGDDHAHRSRRIRLRSGNTRKGGEGGARAGESKKLSAGLSHRASALTLAQAHSRTQPHDLPHGRHRWPRRQTSSHDVLGSPADEAADIETSPLSRAAILNKLTASLFEAN